MAAKALSLPVSNTTTTTLLFSLPTLCPTASGRRSFFYPRRHNRRVLLAAASIPSDAAKPDERKPPRGTGAEDSFTIPRKRRRGRRSEKVAVEDFVRGRLEATFAAIKAQDPSSLEGKGPVLKPAEEAEPEEMVVEEEDPDWPLDAEVGWGVKASEYFDKHPIRNVVVGGEVIDWEREIEEGWVKEINCLEWESFAFHPSPLIVLIFERYNRPANNWRALQELEKAAKVYWDAKDRLPPRTVKIDVNIEKDLARALKARECPQLLFLRGNKILHREKELRSADELVQMIAHFYYNAKRPAWMVAEGRKRIGIVYDGTRSA